VVTGAETMTGFLRNSKPITSHHLNLNTERKGIIDRLLGVSAGRVIDSQKIDEFKPVALSLVIGVVEFLLSDSKGMKTTSCEILNVLFEAVLNLVGLVARADVDDRVWDILASG
jgi:hypothetical protein